jgi:hypothetical protein
MPFGCHGLDRGHGPLLHRCSNTVGAPLCPLGAMGSILDRGHGPLLHRCSNTVGAPLCPVGAMGSIAGMARSYIANRIL